MKYIYILFILLALGACQNMSNHDSSEEMISLTLEEANRLSKLPLQCIQEEYPNKLNQTLASKQYLKSPSELHPAFYGCFDWHSSVHGHWMLISLLNDFPDLDQRSEIITKLKMNMSYTNILAEVNYFFQPQNESFERTYGWAWVLKLAEELHRWDDPIARELEKNLQPLTDLIVKKYLEFLPKLIYPIRVGEHTNIAFGLSLAYDYAVTLNEKELAEMIRSRSRDWFLEDKGCPMNWEPSGYDFLSPCFQEIDIMRKVLEPEEFGSWIEEFMPELKEKSYTLTPGQVSDRTDGKLVHLDGLNFSRAWCIYGLASAYPDKYSHLIRIANEHVNYSLPSIVDDNYEGTHWLGSFAVYALQQKNQ